MFDILSDKPTTYSFTHSTWPKSAILVSCTLRQGILSGVLNYELLWYDPGLCLLQHSIACGSYVISSHFALLILLPKSRVTGCYGQTLHSSGWSHYFCCHVKYWIHIECNTLHIYSGIPLVWGGPLFGNEILSIMGGHRWWPLRGVPL